MFIGSSPLTAEAKLPAAEIEANLVENATIWKLEASCWVTLIAIAVVRAWLTRYELYYGDSLAYLDIARDISAGHWGAAIHAYWSPGYPVLVSFFLRLFRPGIHWEFPFVHFINVLIFLGALTAFRQFWSEVWMWHEQAAGAQEKIPWGAFWALGYAAFSIATLNVIRVGLIGPDLLVAAFCCLSGWSMLRFRRAPGIGRALLLGLILALGYYAKAPFFPMGIIFILCACFKWPLSRRMMLLGGTALATFLLVCAPFVTALSLSKGRFTFGDSSRLNYAFYVNGVQYHQHWQGGPPGAGMPIHPTRKLNDHPSLYEFNVRNMGTYPAWFDPTYWYEGVTPHPDWRRQATTLVSNIAVEINVILGVGPELVCVAVTLALLTGGRRWTREFWRVWFIWIPGASALVMFAMVHIEQRFLGGWLVIIFAGVVCACSLPAGYGAIRAVQCIGVGLLVTAGASLLLQIARESVGPGSNSRSVATADFLLKNGLHPGDGVAVIGNGSEAYWAHLAQLRVVAEIPAVITSLPDHPALDFWESGSEQQAKALKILETTGAKAVIAGSPSVEGSVPSTVPSPWKQIGASGAFVYFFPVSQQ